MALTLLPLDVTLPATATGTGSVTVRVTGTSGQPVQIGIAGITSSSSTTYLAPTGPDAAEFTASGIAAGTYNGDVADGQGLAIGFQFTIGQAVLGCTAANAFNYDQAATQDTQPTSCVFVVVDAAPSGLIAAHLPIPVQLRAAPTLAGYASIVVLLLETAPDLATPDAQWVEFGRLRAVCDRDASASFNLSEAAKALLRIVPPVEAGPDPALSALLRVRYQVLDPLTLTVTYSGLVSTCRALNAVRQSTDGAALTTVTPYPSMALGGQLWQSVATYAAGVTSSLLALPTDGCAARQFVWLNAAGAWDQGFFTGRHVHGTDQADSISYRDLAGADRYAKRGTVRSTLQVYSDKVDWPTYLLLRGVRTSVQVYERLGAGQYLPVLVSTESYTEYQEVTDKTWQVNFTVSYPAQLIQTQ